MICFKIANESSISFYFKANILFAIQTQIFEKQRRDFHVNIILMANSLRALKGRLVFPATTQETKTCPAGLHLLVLFETGAPALKPNRSPSIIQAYGCFDMNCMKGQK